MVEEKLMSQEEILLSSSEDYFGIYQLKSGEEMHYYRFENLDRLEKFGLKVEKDNYELIYIAHLREGQTLEDIFEEFNSFRPEDFTGHSLSISDIVVLHQNGKNKVQYVDSIGFQKIDGFLKKEIQVARKLNIACRQSIEAAIREKYDGTRLSHDAIQPVLEKFSIKRVAYVLANTVQQKEWDGRFSHDTKAWAKTISIFEDNNVWGDDCNREFVVESHPGVLDLFIRQVQKELQTKVEDIVTISERINSENSLNNITAEKSLQKKQKKTCKR